MRTDKNGTESKCKVKGMSVCLYGRYAVGDYKSRGTILI